MFKIVLIALLPWLVFFSGGSEQSFVATEQNSQQGNTGTLEKMIVANGSVSMDIDLGMLNGAGSRSKGTRTSTLRFDTERDAFFTILVLNNELRGPQPSSMNLIPLNDLPLPKSLSSSFLPIGS